MFNSFNFFVPDGVFKPHTVTKVAIQKILDLTEHNPYADVCEIGTGCGYVIQTILYNRPEAHGYAFDISDLALEASRYNAKQLNLQDRIAIKKSDGLEYLNKFNIKFDIITMNLPYLPLSVYEGINCPSPKEAFTDGKDGLSLIQKIIPNVARFLKPTGYLIMEYACIYRDKVEALFNNGDWRTVKTLLYNNVEIGYCAQVQSDPIIRLNVEKRGIAVC